jgi:hypothetical protein
MLIRSFGSLDSKPDQVVKIPIRYSFDIHKDTSAFEFYCRDAHCVDFIFPDCKRSQRMMMFLLLACRVPAVSTRTKSVGQLVNGEDALAV